MHKPKKTSIARRLAAAAAFLTSALVAASAAAQDLALRAGRLVDVENGVVLTDRLVTVHGGRIASIEPFRARPEGVAFVDWSAYVVLPGLVDAHTHLVGDIQSADPADVVRTTEASDALAGAAHAKATLDAGFTAVRDVGTYRAFVDVALRDAIDKGLVPGPRMKVAGAYITIPDGGGAVTGLPEGMTAPPEMARGVVRAP